MQIKLREIQTELISLAEAARILMPTRRGRPVNPATIYRWVHRGIRGVKLEAIRIGGIMFTSSRWMEDFLNRLNRGPPRSNRPSTTNGNTENIRADEQLLAKRLSDVGI